MFPAVAYTKSDNKMMKAEPFGILPDGQVCTVYTITNSYGEYVQFLDYGATIHKVGIADSEGMIENVVLSVQDLSTIQYADRGAVIGRCANRIRRGTYSAFGKEYHLEQNSRGHFLHGGSENYANQLFSTTIENGSITFRHRDKGMVGFGCEAEITVRYCFDDFHRLTMNIEMSADGDTIFNPTNHSYFNFCSGGAVSDHKIWIDADNVAAKGEDGIPDGRKTSVAGSPLAFTRPRTLREALSAGGQSTDGQMWVFDDAYLLNKADAYGPAAAICANGRWMKLYTDMPCIVLFIRPEMELINGRPRRKNGYGAICMEPEFVPNAVNCSTFAKPLFRKGEKLLTTTVYEFGAGECCYERMI